MRKKNLEEKDEINILDISKILLSKTIHDVFYTKQSVFRNIHIRICPEKLRMGGILYRIDSFFPEKTFL